MRAILQSAEGVRVIKNEHTIPRLLPSLLLALNALPIGVRSGRYRRKLLLQHPVVCARER